jgi:hypothetical protein
MKDKHLQRFIEAGLGVGYYKQETSKVIAFEEWWTPRKPRLWEYIGGDVPTLAAKAAWNYQQERIKLLEQRIIDLQGHDDLSYIDRKLSEQEEVERLRAKKKQIYEDLKDAVEREWVGLTDDEVEEVFSFPFHYRSFYKAVEAKLKEKNGG